MTRDAALLALADRCEAASGPLRALDVEIARALPQFGGMLVYRRADGEWRKAGRVMGDEWDHPLEPLTADAQEPMDRVGTLLPGHSWDLASHGHDEGVYQNGKAGAWVRHPLTMGGSPCWKGFAATPALALWAAILRAKAAALAGEIRA